MEYVQNIPINICNKVGLLCKGFIEKKNKLGQGKNLIIYYYFHALKEYRILRLLILNDRKVRGKMEENRFIKKISLIQF